MNLGGWEGHNSVRNSGTITLPVSKTRNLWFVLDSPLFVTLPYPISDQVVLILNYYIYQSHSFLPILTFKDLVQVVIFSDESQVHISNPGCSQGSRPMGLSNLLDIPIWISQRYLEYHMFQMELIISPSKYTLLSTLSLSLNGMMISFQNRNLQMILDFFFSCLFRPPCLINY